MTQPMSKAAQPTKSAIGRPFRRRVIEWLAKLSDQQLASVFYEAVKERSGVGLEEWRTHFVLAEAEKVGSDPWSLDFIAPPRADDTAEREFADIAFDEWLDEVCVAIDVFEFALHEVRDDDVDGDIEPDAGEEEGQRSDNPSTFAERIEAEHGGGEREVFFAH